MAKKQRGSTRGSTRPATPPPASNKSAGQKSGEKWTPNRVSATTKKKSGPNRTLLMTIGAVVVGVLIVAFVMVQQLGSKPVASSDALVTPGNLTPATVPVDGLTMGDPNAPATIDLWGDFRCSACYQFTEGGTGGQINSQLVATGKAKVVWHDYTVIDLHDGSTASRDAANAARCAADQNKFWVMHDWLYANQSATEDASAFTIDRLLKIGEAAGMDMATFTPCVQNGTHNAAIAQEQSSLPAGVTGTPTTIVNGTVVQATFPAIEAAVLAANGSAAPASSGPSASAKPSASGG